MHDDLDVLGSATSEEHQYLTFTVSKETFAIAVLDTKEIIELTTITHVPQMQEFVAGVTNVRGKVIPVIELGSRLGIDEKKEDNKTCIIVETSHDNERLEIGLIIDAVDQVYSILPETTEVTPNFGTRVRKEFIARMAKVGETFVSILDLSRLLDINELSLNHFNHDTEQGAY